MAPSTAQRAAAAKKRAQAVALRLAGMDWATIAERTGYGSAGAACTAVKEALKADLKEQAENVEALRTLTVMRYDRLQAAYWAEAIKGDPKAAEIVLKCLAGRAKVEGVDAPAKVEHSGQVVTYQIEGVDLDQLR